ncbi:MAG: GntR family transcriptional regulator [Anaerolineales bacterium]
MVTRNRPLAEQVRLRILEWIHDGTLGQGDGSLPSETEIAERLNISRATVREALSQLERDRLIIRRQGSGTYINPTVRELTSTINELLDPQALIENQNYRAKAGFVQAEWGEVGQAAASVLEIPAEKAAINLSVLYLADSKPAIWLEGIIPADPLKSSDEQLPPFLSLSQFTEQVTGFSTTHSVANIDTIETDETRAQWLGVPVGKPLIVLTDIYLTDYGRPTFYSKLYFVPGMIKIKMLRDSYGRSGRVSVW